jgi:AbrB family looped-hinge helix DNA binding protein
LCPALRKAENVDAVGRVTSRGRVTIPKPTRDALGIRAGDEVLFRVDGNRATVARSSDFLALEGSVEVPVAKRGGGWDEVVRRTRAERAATRH